ncbi:MULTISPECIES: hypothetical protein [unclassified Frankia]|uniref:hypothetical protein n=1 Tax=unclassified Frankia TaxID=2632575 RepID=UPI002023DCB9
MSADAAEAAASTPISPRSGGSAATPVKIVTTVIVTVVGLTFLFSFGNIFALGLRLGVSLWVAPLVAPAVDLSVVGLLLGTRHLALHGGPADVQRSARRLLIFASIVTLALNIAEPLITRQYGKAAFDAVGPLLLIGWAEVGPKLIQAMQGTGTGTGTTQTSFPTNLGPGFHTGKKLPTTDQRDLASPCIPHQQKMDQPSSRGHRRRASEQDLLHRARAEDALHWETHHRPISAETLRKHLHVGAPTARNIVTQLRTDTHARLDNGADTDIPSGEGNGVSEP